MHFASLKEESHHIYHSHDHTITDVTHSLGTIRHALRIEQTTLFNVSTYTKEKVEVEEVGAQVNLIEVTQHSKLLFCSLFVVHMDSRYRTIRLNVQNQMLS